MNTITKINNSDLSLIPLHQSIDFADWVVIGLCILTILLSRIINSNYIVALFKSKDFSFSNNKVSLISLLLNYIFTLSLFIKSIIEMNGRLLISPFYTYLILTSILIGITIIKFLTMLSITNIFGGKNNFHTFYHLKFYQITGVVMLPLYIFSYFFNEKSKFYLLSFAFILYVLLIIIREMSAFIIAIKNSVSFLYIILYLCTLEILPLILFIKILVG
jgi:hypothetical protein